MLEHKSFYGIAEAVNTGQGIACKYLPMNTFDPKSKGDAIFETWYSPIVKINATCDRLPLDRIRVIQLEGILVNYTKEGLPTDATAHLIVREEKLTRYRGGSETSASMWYRQEMSAKELAERIKQDKPRKSSEGLVQLAHRVYSIQKAASAILWRGPETGKIGYVFRQSSKPTAQMRLSFHGTQGILEIGEQIDPITQLISPYGSSYQSQSPKSALSPEKPARPQLKGRINKDQLQLFPKKKRGPAKVIPIDKRKSPDDKDEGIIIPSQWDKEVPF